MITKCKFYITISSSNATSHPTYRNEQPVYTSHMMTQLILWTFWAPRCPSDWYSNMKNWRSILSHKMRSIRVDLVINSEYPAGAVLRGRRDRGSRPPAKSLAPLWPLPKRSVKWLCRKNSYV